MNRTGLHWHEKHTEYLIVSSGKAFVTVNGITSIIDSNSGEICIPIGIIHEWGLIEDNNNQEDLIIWERTEPNDGEKEIFFRNMILSLIDSSIGNPYSSKNINNHFSIRDILQILIIFRSLDNYPIIWNSFGKKYFTYFILNIANLFGKLFFSLKPIYIEYTPQYFWEKYKFKYQ